MKTTGTTGTSGRRPTFQRHAAVAWIRVIGVCRRGIAVREYRQKATTNAEGPFDTLKAPSETVHTDRQMG